MIELVGVLMIFLLSVVLADESMERLLTSYSQLSKKEIADAVVKKNVSNGVRGAKITIHHHTQGTIFQYRYAREGIPLWGQRVSVLVDHNHRALLRSGTITPGLFKASDVFAISSEVATELAVTSLLSLSSQLDCTSLSSNKQEQYLECIAEEVVWRTNPRLMKIYWVDHGEIVPSYRLELVGTYQNTSFAQELIIDASNGAELYSSSLRVHAEDYYVWGDEEGFYPTPFGASSGNGFVSQSWNTGDWDVYDGHTKSNHVEAYSDRMEPDGFSNGDHYAFAPFDQEFDPNKSPDLDNAQRSVGITQLFYIINQLHERFLVAGFDEASGIAQRTNQGSAGEAGDPMHAEAQDFSGFNNANMMTPADGSSPVMQMYLWQGEGATLEITDSNSLSGVFEVGTADFGRSQDVEGNVQLINDGQGNTRDGCEPFEAQGCIALIERGNCTFVDKAQNARNGGAIAALIYNEPSAPPDDVMGMGGDTFVDIPVYSVSRNTGSYLMQENLVGVSITLPLFRDSSMDGQIVAHEWSHYMFARLTTGGQSAQYGAMNEGTSDFLALLTGTRFDDVDLDGAFPVGGFSDLNINRGIRRAPYSTDSSVYPMTFRHIKDGTPLPAFINGEGRPNSQSHSAGEVWCNTLWKTLVLLVQEHGGTEGAKRMREYLVMALKMMPEDPSYLEGRDAFLGVSAVDVVDYLHFWDAFSQMGMGIDAQSGDKQDEGNQGVQESFSASGRWVGLDVFVDDADISCDDDGILDVGERGVVTIVGHNLGGENLIESQNIEVFDAQGNRFDGLTFPEGVQVDINLGVLEEGTFSLPVQFTQAPSGPLLLRVGDQDIRLDLHVDEEANTQFVDGFTHDDNVWTLMCEPDCAAWGRDRDEPLDPVMWGKDLGIGSDSALISPYVQVRSDQDFTISWSHRYSFEKTDGVAYDGGVVEISIDDGPWRDLDEFVDMPYTDRITILSNLPHVEPEANAPIADRLAFSGESPGYPEYRDVNLNFGQTLAGRQIRVRFRIGTDIAVSAIGWYIDTVLFTGIEVPPFTGFVENKDDCVYPVAEAGDEQVLSDEWKVQLNGRDSYDPEGGVLRYSWVQLSGPDVELFEGYTARPFFFPPNRGKLEFQLMVENETGLTDVDTVLVRIPQDDGLDIQVESGCSHRGGGKVPFWMLLLMGGVLRRRRDY